MNPVYPAYARVPSFKGGMRVQRPFRSIIAGFIIGVGCILPGVSGGVMAVCFGLYRPMLDAVLTLFRNPRSSLRFLFPLALGGGLGMLFGAQGLSALMKQHESLMLFLFTGFILGGIPGLVNEAKQREPFHPQWLLSLALGIALALPLILVHGQGDPISILSPMQAAATGLLEGVGTVVPGISTSFVLIRLGWYAAYLRALSSLDLSVLLFIGAGFALSALLSMKAVQWLFDHAAGHAYFAVLGFLLVSVAVVFPGFDVGRLFWAETALLISGIIIARLLGQIESCKGVNE